MALLKNPRDPEQPICRHLRTKASFVPDLQDPVFLEREEPFHQYFCLRTLHNVGPDDDVVCAEECTQRRICFEPIAGQVA